MIKKPQSRYLKAGQGKLVSEYHGETNFSKKRKEKIIKEQEEREKEAKSNARSNLMSLFGGSSNNSSNDKLMYTYVPFHLILIFSSTPRTRNRTFRFFQERERTWT